MDEVECVVIGAGVIGLAVARRLARAGKEVVVLEAQDTIGTETSSRNSEVIHAGMYYPSDSLKARMCVAGNRALYRYCADHGVAHRRLGKLIVATSTEEFAALDRILDQSRINATEPLQYLDAQQVNAREPNVRCAGALESPATGIIDSHGLMLAYQGDAEDHGMLIAFRTRVVGATLDAGGITLRVVDRGGESYQLRAAMAVNSAGLHACDLAARFEGFEPANIPDHYFSKGNYFTLPGKAPFKRLIYPVPAGSGLGVHVTLDLAGQVRFGPDTEAVDKISYDVDPARRPLFETAIRRYFPELEQNALVPAYSGIRPKLGKPGDASGDFVIQGPEMHGHAGLVNLFGIESPGLTASLPIADEVARQLDIH